MTEVRDAVSSPFAWTASGNAAPSSSRPSVTAAEKTSCVGRRRDQAVVVEIKQSRHRTCDVSSKAPHRILAVDA
jgi:hypothetical protein